MTMERPHVQLALGTFMALKSQNESSIVYLLDPVGTRGEVVGV